MIERRYLGEHSETQSGCLLETDSVIIRSGEARYSPKCKPRSLLKCLSKLWDCLAYNAKSKGLKNALHELSQHASNSLLNHAKAKKRTHTSLEETLDADCSTGLSFEKMEDNWRASCAIAKIASSSHPSSCTLSENEANAEQAADSAEET